MEYANPNTMPVDPPTPLPTEIFRSKVDRWLVVLVIGLPVLGMALAMAMPSSRAGLGALAGLAIAACSTLLVLLVFAWIYRSTTYTLDADALVIRCAGLTWRVAYGEMRSVRPTHNPLSAPALSLHRLEIRYATYGWVLISPDDPGAFVSALKRRVPHLEVKP